MSGGADDGAAAPAGDDVARSETVEKIRLFVAVRVPEEHLEAVDRATVALRGALPNARWVPLANQHVTLKFLGWMPSDRVRPVAEVVSMVAAGRAPSECAVTGLGAFPSTRRARVVWAGLDDPAGLLAGLASDLEASLEPLGFPREDRTFTPHLTIARLKAPRRVEGLLPELPAGLPPFPVRSLVLFRSRLQRSGARYEPVGSFELG